MLKQWLRQWLGIEVLTLRTAKHNRDLDEVFSNVRDLANKVNALDSKVSAIRISQSVVMGKLAPEYAKDPCDPKVRAESDEIGRKAMARFEAEQKVRDQYSYNPPERQ